MSPSDALIRPLRQLWLPARGCPDRVGTPNGASQVPVGSFGTRCLLSPRGVRQVHLIEPSPPILASASSADWPLPLSCNEAEPSSRNATARALAFPSVNGQDRSHPLKGRLHDSRPTIMANTFQLTRTTKLAWHFPKTRKGKEDSSRIVVDCAYHLHREIGPGLSESVYEEGVKRIVNGEQSFVSSCLRVNQKVVQSHRSPRR
jgi:hypothetical protein